MGVGGGGDLSYSLWYSTGGDVCPLGYDTTYSSYISYNVLY